MTHRPQLVATLFLATLASSALAAPRFSAQSSPNAPATISPAVCPVVYQLDASPGRRGYHYIFYGNAFFINRDGYLLTAAHVLSEFRDGGQPSILLSRPNAPPRLVKVSVIATDVVHDVAILRATPNPFDAGYTVAALPLADAQPAAGDPLSIQALRPARAKDPETFELPVPESYSATTLDYRAINLDPASINSHSAPVLAPAQLTDIFLFNHEVLRGQSGAPVTSDSTHQVVGLIEGRWLHPSATSPARTQGAAVPISYALPLLQRNHIPWTTSPPL